MPIPLTDLDDLTYAHLVAQARTLIPALDPEWTDHNPSDPGITLVELLAWLTDMLVYQVNEVPPSWTRTFLSLLNGPAWTPPDNGSPAALDDETRRSVVALSERYRAATPGDYEHLVTQVWPGSPEAAPLGPAAAVARMRCVAGRNLVAEAAGIRDDAPAHVSVVILPAAGLGPADEHPSPATELIAALEAFLEPRRLLTVRQHVVGPHYVDLQISADLALHEDSPPAAALAAARDRLITLLSPASGGAGLPFGRPVWTSEIYAALDELALVDYIENVQLSGPPPIAAPAGPGGSPAGAAGGPPAGVWLDEHELVRLTQVRLTAYDSYDQSYALTWERS